MAWNPQQYLAFADHRLRPVFDLLARVPAEDPKHVVDLGCGAGNATKILKQTWPAAAITGVDSSPEMLARARKEAPDIAWVEADIATWRPAEKVDVLFTNAALHWLDGHETLFPALAAQVTPGGYLAVQMPANFRAPSHSTIETVGRDPRWSNALAPLIKAPPTKEPDFYYDLLRPITASLDIWHVEYLQVLHGDDAVAEFVKGSWLPQFLDALQDPVRSAFETEYRARLRAAYPKRADGATLFPFKRLFIVARM
jgi:trans-aconitate 2-methyltransferase